MFVFSSLVYGWESLGATADVTYNHNAITVPFMANAWMGNYRAVDSSIGEWIDGKITLYGMRLDG